MAIQTLQQINTSDETLSRVQSNVAQVVAAIQTGPFFGGNVISQGLVSGDNIVIHKLGRIPQYWIQLDLSNGGSLTRPVYRKSWSSSSITINASAACNITIWVS